MDATGHRILLQRSRLAAMPRCPIVVLSCRTNVRIPLRLAAITPCLLNKWDRIRFSRVCLVNVGWGTILTDGATQEAAIFTDGTDRKPQATTTATVQLSRVSCVGDKRNKVEEENMQ